MYDVDESKQIFGDYYHFQHRKVAKRSAQPGTHHHSLLNNDPEVIKKRENWKSYTEVTIVFFIGRMGSAAGCEETSEKGSIGFGRTRQIRAFQERSSSSITPSWFQFHSVRQLQSQRSAVDADVVPGTLPLFSWFPSSRSGVDCLSFLLLRHSWLHMESHFPVVIITSRASKRVGRQERILSFLSSVYRKDPYFSFDWVRDCIWME